MNNEILKLAKECGIYIDDATYPANARELETFYRAAHNAGIEAAAKVCEKRADPAQEFNALHRAANAIRTLEMKK